MQKRLFISWFSKASRSDSFAHHLGARSYHVGRFERRAKIWAPIKYLWAAVKTYRELRRERPDVIFVQNPPVFAVLVVWVYCIVNPARYIVDTHSAAFTTRRWSFFLPLYRFLAKRALLNVAHNEPITNRITVWGAPGMTLEAPPHLVSEKSYPIRPGFNLVSVCSFTQDEPVDAILEAARGLPEVNFYITAKPRRGLRETILRAPSNVIFTGFLPQEDFVALLKGADVVMSLTNVDHTMQSAAYEALELERPIITSDWPVLKEYWHKGTVHINNTAGAIIGAVNEIQDNYARYSQDIQDLRRERYEDWQRNFAELITVLSGIDLETEKSCLEQPQSQQDE